MIALHTLSVYNLWFIKQIRHFLWKIYRTAEGGLLCLLGLWILICFCPAGQAVVIVTGDGSGNTSASNDDPGWNYVGRVGDGSGVYLGKYGPTNNPSYWVLTASHVSLRNLQAGDSHSFHLGDTSYNIKEGSKTTIRFLEVLQISLCFQLSPALRGPHWLSVATRRPSVPALPPSVMGEIESLI